MSKVWTIEEAFEQHNGMGRMMKPEDVVEENITDADRFLLDEVKRTEGMSDSDRIKILHCALGKVLPYLTEAPVRKFKSKEERFKSIGERLVNAYKEYCDNSAIAVSKRLLRSFSDLDFNKFYFDDWVILADMIGLEIAEEDYDSDIKSIYETASVMKNLQSRNWEEPSSIKKVV